MLLEQAIERAREISASVLTAECVQIDRERAWPENGLRALQAAGLAGLVLPASAGGLQLGLYGLARVSEVLGEVCPSTAICFGMHCVGSAVLAARATEGQRRDYLEPIAQGRHLTTLALSEPGTGSHFYLPETAVTRSEEGFVLNGTKSFVTNGSHADSYVVSTASEDPDRAPGEFSCFIVPAATPGLRWQGQWEGWGMRGNSSLVLKLKDVAVPPQSLLGKQGDEIWYVFHVVAPYFLTAMAGTYLGIANAALLEAKSHLSSRRFSHSGETLSASAILQHRVGTLWAQVERLRSLIYSAAQKADAGAEDALMAVCAAKAECGDVERIVADVMTLLGGKGYSEDSRIHKMFRDARAAHVMAPTTDILRTWTGRAFLGLPMLGD